MTRNHLSARTINLYLPKILKPALKKRGFPAMALIAQWPEIAGDALAAHAVPERVSWPRRAQTHIPESEDPAVDRTAARSRTRGDGATLRLRVDPVMALEVEYQKAQILERINTFFGYQAVTSLKIVQGPVAACGTVRSGTPVLSVRDAVEDIDFDAIADDRLRAALTRLNTSRRR